MDDYIRQLTHDNKTFENQWPKTFDELHKFINNYNESNINILSFKVKILDAAIDYVLSESIISEQPVYAKVVLVRIIIKFVGADQMPSFIDILRIFRRILDVNNIYNQWYLSVIELFHYELQLFKCLISTKSVDLIK
ncbi:unnamed protein product [Rotaria sp. Silwood2]|nr:unnamed protein product [Rotaria sp. Silwood2]